MYDAWTAYANGSFVSTTTFARLKRAEEEHTRQNREIAFSFAAFRVLGRCSRSVWQKEHEQMFATLMMGSAAGPTITLGVTETQGDLQPVGQIDHRGPDSWYRLMLYETDFRTLN